MAVRQNLVPLVNIKIAGKWMFIPKKMVLIGIDPYPYYNILWMEEILHQLVDGLSMFISIYGASTILLVVQDFLTIHCIITHIRNIEYVLQVTGNRMEQEYEIGVISCTNQPVWDGTGVFLFRSCAMLVTLSSYAYDEQTGKNLGA